MSDPIVIVSAARTPMGSFQGGFSGLTAANSAAPRRSRAAVVRAGIDANLIEEVLMAALQAGQGQAPAARLRCRPACRCPPARHHPQGLRFGHEGDHARPRRHPGRFVGAAVVGGMESMTNAPTCC